MSKTLHLELGGAVTVAAGELEGKQVTSLGITTIKRGPSTSGGGYPDHAQVVLAPAEHLELVLELIEIIPEDQYRELARRILAGSPASVAAGKGGP